MKLFKDLEKVLKMYGFKKVIAIPLDFSGRILFERLKREHRYWMIFSGPQVMPYLGKNFGHEYLGTYGEAHYHFVFKREGKEEKVEEASLWS